MFYKNKESMGESLKTVNLTEKLYINLQDLNFELIR